MPAEQLEVPRLAAAEHPENRLEAETAADPLRAGRPISFCRGLCGMWIAGMVGSLLTLMTVAYPLGAGDTTAALSILPLVLVLIAIVNGWIAANLFIGSGLEK
jgi:hypothetical protein